MILDKFRLDGKTALVTGCNKGIGRMYAKALAEDGADIVGVALEGMDEDVLNEFRSFGRKAYGFTCDFSKRNELYSFIYEVQKLIPKIDILVNNAGMILRKPISEHPDEYWDKVIEVNLNAQFILTREFGKCMVERGNGKIVFIASLLSFQGGIWVPGYAASKGAVKQLCMAFSNEWAQKGVNINAIAPGYIATDNTKALREDELRNKAILERIPAGRWGTPEDLMGTVVFLCSEASDYINGSLITVDGGWMGR
ncbi:MAG: SDR family NAD(P)-dependent oxidoreductase [Bacteroidota bacterium]|nr:SDR family NAD(P)-dependent oxidoreductase [Bacteroidota bacterium]